MFIPNVIAVTFSLPLRKFRNSPLIIFIAEKSNHLQREHRKTGTYLFESIKLFSFWEVVVPDCSLGHFYTMQHWPMQNYAVAYCVHIILKKCSFETLSIQICSFSCCEGMRYSTHDFCSCLHPLQTHNCTKTLHRGVQNEPRSDLKSANRILVL